MPESMPQEAKLSLQETLAALPADIKGLLPDDNMPDYDRTNQMHCGPGTGGSKFEDPRIRNIFDVVRMAPKLRERVDARQDDREALAAVGTAPSSFLPATKGPDAPSGLPEALYYKVDGIKGRLGIIKIGELSPETRVLVRREKGTKDQENKPRYCPASFTVIQGTPEDMPKTDFATVIVGRDALEHGPGPDAVWTVHPGSPIRPIIKDYEFTADLAGPEEEGPKYIVMTVAELKEKTQLSDDDYIKIAPGDLEEEIAKIAG